MEKPIVQLKKLSFFEGHDGYGMNADIWIDGVKCMHVYDGAFGGCYEYTEFRDGTNPDKDEKVKQLIADLNAYIDTLPEEELMLGENKWMQKVDLDHFINDLAIQEQDKKEKKAFERRMKTAILVGVPNAPRFMQFKFKIPLRELHKSLLQHHVDKIKKEHCNKDNVILNTNLESLGIKL